MTAQIIRTYIKEIETKIIKRVIVCVVRCGICGGEFETTKSKFERGRRYCSPKCGRFAVKRLWVNK